MEGEEFKEKREKAREKREIIYRALLDPDFRRQLEEDPVTALDIKRMTPEKKAEIRMVVATVKSIRDHIRRVSDQLLCANGGPCGIA